jgi:predicted aminopeptidase
MTHTLTRLLVCALCLGFGSGCNDAMPGYLLEQGLKQGGLLLKGESINDLIAKKDLDPKTEHSLKLALDVVDFAKRDLQMNTGGAYQKFVRLDRPWVTQIVMAAYPDRLEPYLFSYPLFGDLPYKGFFDESEAQRLEQKLKTKGLDTFRRPVEAFSSTGWLPDPLISTMLTSDARLIEILIHELTHTHFYFASEADFNEAFASWMGFKGALMYIDARGPSSTKAALKAELEAKLKRQKAFAVVIKQLCKDIKALYESKGIAARVEAFSLIQKRLSQTPGLEHLASEPWNNALLLSYGTYYELFDPIDQYAVKHKLSPPEFLKRVKSQGPSIIAEIAPKI